MRILAWRALLLTALLSAGVFATQSTNGGPVEEPPMRDADRVQYTVQSREPFVVQFEWAGTASLPLTDGSVRTARVLRETMFLPTGPAVREHFLDEDGSFLASSIPESPVTIQRQEVRVLSGAVAHHDPRLPLGTHDLTIFTTVTEFLPLDAGCRLSRPVDPTSRCSGPGTPPLLSADGSAPGTVVFVWESGLPYPVSIRVEDTTAVLTGYRGHGEPIAWQSTSRSNPPSDVSLLPSTRLGPARPSGPEAFPLDDAVAHALEYCGRGFTRQPWYLAAARSFVVLRPEKASESAWDLTFSLGGTRSVHAFVQTVTSPEKALLWDDPAIYCVEDWDDKLRPEPDAFPAMMPSADAVIAAWNRARPTLDATGWGFEVVCRQDCTSPAGRVWAGRASIIERVGPAHPVVDPIGTSWTGVIDVVGADERGDLRFQIRSAMDGHAPLVAFDRLETPRQATASSIVPGELPRPSWYILPAAALGLAFLLKAVVVWLLHTRLHKSDLLDHPTRARIVALIEAEPGVHYRRLLKETGQVPGTLSHHLGVLERARLIRRSQYRGYTCFFLPTTPTESHVAAIVARSDAAQWILKAVHEEPGITAKRLAARRRVHPSTIVHHVQKLVHANMLERTRIQDGLALRLTPVGKAFLRSPSGQS